MYYVYVIEHNLTQHIYIGQTNDLEKRLARHNGTLTSKKSSYTHRIEGEWKYIYQEEYETRQLAVSREKELKSGQGRKYLEKYRSRVK